MGHLERMKQDDTAEFYTGHLDRGRLLMHLHMVTGDMKDRERNEGT